MGAYGRREYSFLFLLVVFVIRQSECNPYRLGKFNATGLNDKVNARSAASFLMPWSVNSFPKSLGKSFLRFAEVWCDGEANYAIHFKSPE